jgi:hypothetical protein
VIRRIERCDGVGQKSTPFAFADAGSPSRPRLSGASTSCFIGKKEGVDGQVQPGHDML